MGERAAQALASAGNKSGAERPAVGSPWYKAPWRALTLALGLKGALAALAAAAVGVLGLTSAFVLADIGKKSADDVAAVEAGSGDKGPDQDEDPTFGTGAKPGDPTTTTIAATTTTAEGSEPGGQLVPEPGAPGTTAPTPTTTPPTAPTTTQPPGPRPDVLRFVAGWAQSGNVPCSGNTYAFVFTWSSVNATSATLGPTAGGANLTGLPPEGSRVACGNMDEEWKLTVTGPGGTDSSVTRTPYLG